MVDCRDEWSTDQWSESERRIRRWLEWQNDQKKKKTGSVQYCMSPASVWCQSAKVTLLTFSSGLRDKQATRGSNRQNHWTVSRPWTPESLIQEITRTHTHTHPTAHYRGSWSPLQNSLCWVQTPAPLCNCRALLKKKKLGKIWAVALIGMNS